MLHTEDVGEGHGQPAFGDGSREAVAIRWIREPDVERLRLQLLDESHRVRTVDAKLVAGSQQLGVLTNRPDARGAHLDEVRGSRAP